TPIGVALDVRLALARDSERARRHILCDHRAGGGAGLVPERYGCDERRVHARVHAAADRGAVLGGAIVVGGDGRGAEVRALAYVSVPDVGEVGNFRAGA